ncbi:MAG: hypothetical protein ACYCVG_09395 [Leptospirillum sp.]
MMSPHLFVPVDSFGGFDGPDNQRIERVPVQGGGSTGAFRRF